MEYKPDSHATGNSMMEVLDRTLSSHLERITGTRQGIQGLPIDIVTVACIVLLAERAQEHGRAQATDRVYRKWELEQDLAEMGLADQQRLQRTMSAMASTGYMEIDSRGGITPGKAVTSMASLLDHAFPGMPGINLVAYLVQTLEEVETGRKGAKDAVMQLDQMLRRHGAAGLRGASGPSKLERSVSSGNTLRSGSKIHHQEKRRMRLSIPAEMVFPAPQETSPPEESLFEGPAREGWKAEGDSETEISDDHMVQDTEPVYSPEDSPDGEFTGQDLAEHPERGGPVEQDSDSGASAPDLPCEEEIQEGRRSAQGATISATEASSLEQTPELDEQDSFQEPKGKQPGVEQDFAAVPLSEDPIHERVAAFEEELAMQCPLCRKSSVIALETAKGRTYYKCSDEQCIFISWGKPHHVACPLCGNPFLVESSSVEGSAGLRCPRATCRYREGPSDKQEGANAEKIASRRLSSGKATPRRRVVRRRVMRKNR